VFRARQANVALSYAKLLYCNAKMLFDIYVAVQYNTDIQEATASHTITETTMFTNFDEIVKANKEAFEKASANYSVFAKGYQTIATEVADYAKKAFEANTAALEKLTAVKSVEKAIELQTETGKAAYEAAVAQGTKITALITDLAKEAAKPFEALVPKAAAKAAK
jgi:hypothetical protein